MHQIGPACRAFIFKGLEKLVSAKLPPAVGHREQNYPFCSPRGPGAGPWTQWKRSPSPALLRFWLVLDLIVVEASGAIASLKRS
jgi:hypothetical protein